MRMTQLKTIADIQTGPFGSQLHKEDYVETGTPIVTVEHLGNRVFTEQNLPRVSDSDKARLIKYTLSTGDIVFSRVGSVDRCSYVDKSHDGWMFSGRCLRVRPTELVDSLYLYYYFCLEETKQFVRNIAVGATMPSINTKLLGEVEIALPDLNNQKRIAAVLSSLDDKIENNQKLNDNLVELCKTEFMRTFATHPEYRDEQSDWFSHPLGKSLSRVAMGPFGSNIKTDCFVDHGVPVLNGDNISGYLLSERSFRYVEEEKASQLKNSIAVSGDIVITHRGTLGQVALVPDKTKFDRYVISQSQFLLTCDQCTLLPEYILFYFHTDAGRRKLLANDNTTGVPSIAKPTSYIKALHIPIPPIELQQNWAVLVRATLAAVADNNLEMEKLTGFAQTLLSGLSR